MAARWRSRGTARRRTITTSTSSWWGLGEPIRLTDNRTRDDSPAWSPDGKEIAFLRWLPHSDATVDVMVVPALGHAAERRVGTVTLQSLAYHLSTELDAGRSLDGYRCRRARRKSRDLVAVKGRTRETPPDHRAAQRVLQRRQPCVFIRRASHGVHSARRSRRGRDPRPHTLASVRADWQSCAGHDGVASHIDLAWAGDDAALVFSSGASQGQSRLQRLPLRSDRLAPSGPASVLPFGGQATSLSLSRGRAVGLRGAIQGHQSRTREPGRACERSHRVRRGRVDVRRRRPGLFARRQAHRVQIDEDREPGTVGLER